MGKDIMHVGVWKKGDDRMVYNMIYTDGASGKSFAKRFTMPAITRDKEYVVGTDNPNTKVHYLTANPNGEAQLVEVKLSQSSTARKKVFEYDFSELEIKGRGTRGNTITKYPVRKVDLVEQLGTTLGGLELWFDDASGRLNKDGRGKKVGKFNGSDQIIAISKSGNYKITSFDLGNRFEPDHATLLIEKFNIKKVISAVYWDGVSKQHFVKRFKIETTTPDKDFNFISEGIGSRLEYATTAESPEIEMDVVKGKSKEKLTESVSLEDIVDVKGWKALGNRLSQNKVLKVRSTEEPEESGSDHESEDEKSSGKSANKKAAESKASLSPKKKEETNQSSLFEESQQKNQPEKQEVKSKAKAPKQKEKQKDQVNLFGESEENKPNKAFDVGETVEFDL
jgi:topoisomerase-4 subunit A